MGIVPISRRANLATDGTRKCVMSGSLGRLTTSMNRGGEI
jgi:hypothetical protein